MEVVKTQALVLHRYPFRDSSWVVKALTPDRGIVAFLVRGAKRHGSPFRSAFDPLTHIELVYRHSARREIQLPSESRILCWHPRIRDRLEALAIAQTMGEVILRASRGDAQSHAEFALLRAAWESLEKNPGAHQDALATFLWKFLDLSGVEMRLDFCVRCHEAMREPPADLWPAAGGGICARCLGTQRPHWPADLRVALPKLKENSFPSDLRLIAQIERFLLNYLRIHLGEHARVRSYEWLEELRQNHYGEKYAE